MEKAGQLVRISAKPIFLFRNLLQYLENRRIVVPGYSFMQDAVSQALADERARLTAILEERLDNATSRRSTRFTSSTTGGTPSRP